VDAGQLKRALGRDPAAIRSTEWEADLPTYVT